MTRESLLETLVTAIHQVAASFALPEAIKDAATGVQLNGWAVAEHDLRSDFYVDSTTPRDRLADTLDNTVRCLTRCVATKLGPESSLVTLDSPAHPWEHPQPILLAPGLPIFVGVDDHGGTLFATLRLPFGIATA